MSEDLIILNHGIKSIIIFLVGSMIIISNFECIWILLIIIITLLSSLYILLLIIIF